MKPIAIIGASCRFPQANSLDSFWQLLQGGKNAIIQVPDERWDIELFYASEPATPGKMNTRYGGFVENIDQFEPAFFGISPREARSMDPQQRLCLEVAWEAFELAGIPSEQLEGSATGVFIGSGGIDYQKLGCSNLEAINSYTGTGVLHAIIANRLSYFFDLRGPSMVVDTTCASSLVAIHLACQSLERQETDLCLAGGVHLVLCPDGTITFAQTGVLAPDGKCKTFDASADGYVRGEGCGLVVLKRLEEAQRDRDPILAVIRGTAVNQDGLSNGLTAPNGPAQQAVIRQAIKEAGIEPSDISYVEAHGTGTVLGDPIEVKALKAVLMEGREMDRPCWLGSVKTNIGHLEGASGIAGLIKILLALKHRQIPPHLHLKELNPYISLKNTPFSIPTKCQSWESQQTRIAGISAFSFGGTNAHVIVEEAPNSGESTGGSEAPEKLPHLLTISAKSKEALAELGKRYKQYLEYHLHLRLEDICFTSQCGRSHFEHRLGIIANSTEQLSQKLAQFVAKRTEISELTYGQVSRKKSQKIAFLFTGQGSQYLHMGHQLYKDRPIFRQALDKCNLLLQPYLDRSLLDVLYPLGEETFLIHETAYTQPALFAIEYALFQLWQSWGVNPQILLGHSVGEYVAACVAGIFSLEDGLKLVAARGRLMQSLPSKGGMLAVSASVEELESLLAGYEDEVALAAINSAHSFTLSGQKESLEKLTETLNSRGIKTKRLLVSHGFHSPLMQPMLAEFEEIVRSITYHTPSRQIVSTLTGQEADLEMASPTYWCRQIVEPVKFAQAMATLAEGGYNLFLEIGPKPTLLGLGQQCYHDLSAFWLPSLRPGLSEQEQMLKSLSVLYVQGISIDWSGFNQDNSSRRIPLPTYPWQRQRYWVETAELSPQKTQPLLNQLAAGDVAQLIKQVKVSGKFSEKELQLVPKLLNHLLESSERLPQDKELSDYFYQIEWQKQTRESMLPSLAKNQGSWLIFNDTGGLGEALAQQLGQQGQDCFLVNIASDYGPLETYRWGLNPSEPEQFARLVSELIREMSKPWQGVIHLWGLQDTSTEQLTPKELEQVQVVGYGSVLYLLQALLNQDVPPSCRLWLVTRGTMSLDLEASNPFQGTLWGLGKVIAHEQPQLWGGLIDLEPVVDTQEAKILLREIMVAQGEQIAVRQSCSYGCRLVPYYPISSNRLFLSVEGTYLITGGLGALGLQVTQWLIEQGARNIVLISRRQPEREAQGVIEGYQRRGVKVTVLSGDVSNLSEMTALFEVINQELPPLRGIIHGAGILDDGTFLQQTWEKFKEVGKPKIEGSWNLHTLTQNISLDFFVVFSSAAAVLGSPGQANYAAANAFMDALIRYRRKLGLPGLSINWGPWAETGMAARLSSSNQEHFSSQGFQPISPKQGLEALSNLLAEQSPPSQVVILLIDKNHLQKRGKSLPLRQFLSEVIGDFQEIDSSLQPEWVNILHSSSVKEARTNLINYVQIKVAQVLELPQSSVDTEQSLYELGLDSLMAVDLSRVFQSEIQVQLPIRAFVDNPSIVSLANLVLQQFFPEQADELGAVETSFFDLEKEAQLADEINPNNAIPFDPDRESTQILLTGATGFLGAFLLEELLEQTSAKIYCLVRAEDLDKAFLRLQNNLKSYGLWQQEWTSRLIPVRGDLAKPQLGLEEHLYGELASNIDEIYHNGATLSYVLPYSQMRDINVLGTREILSFACDSKVKAIHHISSVAVVESTAYYGKKIVESDPICHWESIYLGYSQTKWVSEQMVMRAAQRGIPVTIHRPPLISGHSKTGNWNTSGFLCRSLKGYIDLGYIMEDLDLFLDISPVDYVSKAIVYLSRQPNSLGKAFHLQHPQPLHWKDFVDILCQWGYPLKKVSYEEWQAKLMQQKNNTLYSLIPFFTQKWSDKQLTYLELNQQSFRPEISCKETLKALANSSIVCPLLDANLFDIYRNFLVKVDYIPPSRIEQ